MVKHNSDNLFCPICNSLLKLPDLSNIQYCYMCNYKQNYKTDSQYDIVSVSSKYNTHDKQASSDNNITNNMHNNNDDINNNLAAAASAKRATVKEICDKCGHDEMTFYTMQMRSVDEGQTVFYECPNCGYTYSTNT